MILFVNDTGRDRRKKQITLLLRIHQVSIEIRTNYLKYILTLSFLFNNANLNFPCYLPQYQLYYCRYSAYSRFYVAPADSSLLCHGDFCPMLQTTASNTQDSTRKNHWRWSSLAWCIFQASHPYSPVFTSPM